MKKLFIALLLASTANFANAAIINAANVGSYTTFEDTITGRIWFDINNFFKTTNNTLRVGNMISTVQAAGFTFALKSDVQQLFSSLPLDNGR